MRVPIWLTVPVFILALAVMITLLRNRTEGVPLCDTWMRAALPLCR